MCSIRKQSYFVLTDVCQKIPSTIQRLENDADGVVQDALDVWDSIEIKVTNDIIEALDSVGESWLAIGLTMLTIVMA